MSRVTESMACSVMLVAVVVALTRRFEKVLTLYLHIFLFIAL